MYKANDVASLFVDLISPYKADVELDKLMKYAQEWSLIRYGKRLFDDTEDVYTVRGDCAESVFSADDIDMLTDIAVAYIHGTIEARLKGKDVIPKLANVEYVGYRDKEGHLVLPKEWDVK